jgi:hypothetical protein
MVAERLDVRLDREHREKLAKILEAQGTTVSAVVRAWIDQAYEAVDREERVRAVQTLISMQIEDVPDAETLSRQLDETHAIGPLP